MSTKSESPVAAREQLDQLRDPGGQAVESLEKTAKDQEKAQREALDSKLTGPGAKESEKLQARASEAPAEARAGIARGTATQGGFIDQLSRRSANDALEGHFVTVDLSFKGVEDAYKEAGIEGHTGAYGVYLEPMSVHPDTGIPASALVRLRDETNARVTLPYDALSPAQAGGR